LAETAARSRTSPIRRSGRSFEVGSVEPGIAAADFGLSLLDRGRAEQRERLEDFRDFCEFSAQDYRDELMQRWADYRAKRRRS
jgi:hypothetical protein